MHLPNSILQDGEVETMENLILDRLEATCRENPEKVAFADPESEITFARLREEARRAGSCMAKLTPGRTVVPFYLEKGTASIVGFMGAVYAGCAYSQLNLRHPAARIQAMLETLQARLVVTDREHAAQLAEITSLPVLLIEEIRQEPEDGELLRARRGAMTDLDPLYVNFTSGSTGTPKGVVVCHRNVLDFIPVFVRTFSITREDVLANQAPFDFDVSVKDIYSGIFTGARVEIIPTSYFTQPVVLMDFLCDRRVTLMVWAVSALCFLTTMNALAYRTPETVRGILFSGEVMPVRHLNKLRRYLPQAMYVNLYGPTEITCNCTYYVLDREFAEGESLPIGIPFDNERVFLLDEENREVTQPGGVGERCVCGSSVALGYYRDAERTAQVFVQNPLNPCWNETMYRTGDLVRIGENGELVYVSRKDFQVKHMGHRIELTEIDTALQALPGVDRACCQYLEKKGKILAFVSGELDRVQAGEQLRVTLPEYMIPNIFVQVETMPLNKNGKIDRQALMNLYEEKRGKRL